MSFYEKNRPTCSDEGLLAIFRDLNKRIFNDELPEIPINYMENEKKFLGGFALGAYTFDNENIMDASKNYILLNRDIVDRALENTICHEMVHYKTHLIDIAAGVEFGKEGSCAYGNGGHNGKWEELATEIHDKFGIRIDQFYIDTMKSKLVAAGEENWKDDGEDYSYTFYTIEGKIYMQKIDPEAPHMDKFPIFTGRVEELNDVPPTKGNPFDDQNFSNKFLNVYARPVDKYTKKEWGFMETGDFYYTKDGLKVGILFVMR